MIYPALEGAWCLCSVRVIPENAVLEVKGFAVKGSRNIYRYTLSHDIIVWNKFIYFYGVH